MNQIEKKFNEYLRVANNLSNLANLSEDLITSMNSELHDLESFFLKIEISKEEIEKKHELLFSVINSLKEAVQEKQRSHPNKNLSKNQNFGNGGVELFKRLCREIQYVIVLKPYGYSKFMDLVITENEDNSISYSDMITFLDNEINILKNKNFNNFYSFVVYYQEFESRIISHFNLG